MSWDDGAHARRPTALVTGAAGFIGSHLVDRLLGLGWRVRGLDDLSTGHLANLHVAQLSAAFELVEGSVLDERLVARLAAEATRVFHLAARVGPTLVELYPEETVLETIQATRNVLAAVRGRPVPVFFASSSEIYGNSAVQPLHESSDLCVAPPQHPRSSYALARGASELLVNSRVRAGQVLAVIGRMFNAIGPRQSPEHGYVVPRFLTWALANEPIRVLGSGEQTRSFTAVDDVVRALVELLDRTAAYGRTVNIGNDDEVTINELARLAIRLTGSGSTIRYVPYEQEHGAGGRDILRRVPDTTTLRSLVTCDFSTPLETTLRAILADRVRMVPRGPG